MRSVSSYPKIISTFAGSFVLPILVRSVRRTPRPSVITTDRVFHFNDIRPARDLSVHVATEVEPNPLQYVPQVSEYLCAVWLQVQYAIRIYAILLLEGKTKNSLQPEPESYQGPEPPSMEVYPPQVCCRSAIAVYRDDEERDGGAPAGERST